MVLKAGYDDVVRTTIYTGRPMSVYKSPYIVDWYVNWCDPISSSCSTGDRETKRREELERLTSQGELPHEVELKNHPEKMIIGIPCESYSRYVGLSFQTLDRVNGTYCRIHSCTSV